MSEGRTLLLIGKRKFLRLRRTLRRQDAGSHKVAAVGAQETIPQSMVCGHALTFQRSSLRIDCPVPPPHTMPCIGRKALLPD
jgi:hypothetical protein